jgi:hypothetical protein
MSIMATMRQPAMTLVGTPAVAPPLLLSVGELIVDEDAGAGA